VNNPQNYREIKIDYTLKNNSDDISMHGIYVNYDFAGKLKDHVIAYNESHADQEIFLFSKDDISYRPSGYNFKQTILIKSDELTESEISDMIHNSICEVTYFTGSLAKYDGKKFYGTGKHLNKYKLSEIMKN